MRALRLILATMILGTVTMTIAAAPVEKKSSATKVARPSTAGSPTASERIEPIEAKQPSPFEVNPTAIEPATEFAFPEERRGISPGVVTSAGGDPINMNWYSINNGGAIEVAAGNIKMGLSIGQNAVGEVSAGNIKMGLGFWYGAGGASSPSCDCDCHGDPQCDSVVNIFDVTLAVNVAFRNDPAILDPNPLCAYEQRTDVSCDSVTNIFDVTKFVNVAFRNADPAVEFCQPCAPAPNL